MPFFEALGWGIDERRLELPAGHRNDAIDVALLIDGTAAVVVEAKAFKVGISEKDFDQLRSYMLLSKAPWGAITDGQHYRLYYLDARGKEPELVLIYDLLASPPEEIKRFMGRDHVADEDSGRLATVQLAKQRMQRVVDHHREQLEDTLSRWLGKHSELGKGGAQRAVAREYAREMVARLSSAAFQASLPAKGTTARSSEAEVAISPRRGKTKQHGRSHVWGFQVLVDEAERLIAAGELTESDCPVSVGKSKTRYLIHSKAVHPNGRGFFAARRLSNGLWVETHASISRNAHLAALLHEKLG